MALEDSSEGDNQSVIRQKLSKAVKKGKECMQRERLEDVNFDDEKRTNFLVTLSQMMPERARFAKTIV